MTSQENPQSPTKRIAIAIQLVFPLPWHHDCYEGILQYAERHGWSCVVDPHLVGISPDFDPSVYDGVVGRFEDSTAKIVQELEIPAVNHRQPYMAEDQSRVKALPSVCVDKYKAGQLAAEHLVASGYRRFACVGFEDHHDASTDGVSAVLGAQGFGPIDIIRIDGHYDDTRENSIAVRQKLDAWLVRQVTPVGILVLNNGVARFVAQACRELGLRVPHEVGIVGVHGDLVISTRASPSLSAIEFDYTQLGYEAAALLDKLMNGEPASPLHRLLPPKQLLVRESSDVFLNDDPLVSKAMRYIAEHIRENPTIADVAGAVGVSRRTLHRRFNETLGRPVNEEIARLRIDYIQRLLTETDLPIVRIASDCGFSSQSYLTHFFRREAGQTPSAYRKQFKAE